MVGGRRHLDHLVQLGDRRELEAQLEEEAVELGLGQRVGPVHLDRVLGGDDEERRGQRPGLVGDGDVVLLHRLEQGALGARRGAVDLVGDHHVGEDRPRFEAQPRLFGLGALDEDGGAGDVGGHQVRGELDPFRRQFEGAREGAREGRLAEAWNALEQRVAARDQADQRAAHGLGLADHDAADGGLDLCGDALELLGRDGSSSPGGAIAAVSAVIAW